MSLSAFEHKFVVSLPNNDRRRNIMKRFAAFLSVLSPLGVVTEIWIDGSFVTAKETPDDIDVVVFFSESSVNDLDAVKQSRLRYLGANPEASKIRFMTDVRFAPDSDQGLRSYWRGWFGYNRNEEPKGFIRLVEENM